MAAIHLTAEGISDKPKCACGTTGTAVPTIRDLSGIRGSRDKAFRCPPCTTGTAGHCPGTRRQNTDGASTTLPGNARTAASGYGKPSGGKSKEFIEYRQ